MTPRSFLLINLEYNCFGSRTKINRYFTANNFYPATYHTTNYFYNISLRKTIKEMESLLTFDGQKLHISTTTLYTRSTIHMRLSFHMHSSLPFVMIDLVWLETIKIFFFIIAYMLAGEWFLFCCCFRIKFWRCDVCVLQYETKGKKHFYWDFFLSSANITSNIANNAFYMCIIQHSTCKRVFTAYFSKFLK